MENVVGDGCQSPADFGGAGAQFQCIDQTVEPRKLSYTGVQLRNCTETARLSGFSASAPQPLALGRGLARASPQLGAELDVQEATVSWREWLQF